MRGVVVAALKNLEQPVLDVYDERLTEDEIEWLEGALDDQIASLAYLLGHFLPRWKLARLRASLHPTLNGEHDGPTREVRS